MKRPVFGGACRLCPWGPMAEVGQAAMKPYGYAVQICYNCNAADAPRIVSEARLPPPYRPDPAVPEALAPRNAPGLGLLIAAGISKAQQPTPVKVAEGMVQGTFEDGLAVYRGVPFALSPVGDLRWRAPIPAAKWQGVRQAAKFAPGCMPGQRGPAWGSQEPGFNEDCLYLNIWAPGKSASERMPVLVWIYGGGFNARATFEPMYSGEKLAHKRVVLVSISYRVGQLGWLAHPGLSSESEHHASGNYGLLDMIAGLQWVKKNIAAFGGDPQRVTIFGESAGGIAVSMLCASPLAKGLFQGAISESGGSFGPPRPVLMPGENRKRLADAERSGETFAKTAGASSIAELRKIAADKLPSGAPGLGPGLAWPIIDGWVIPDTNTSSTGPNATTIRRFWLATTPTKAPAFSLPGHLRSTFRA